jgi:hypothetical protein
MYCWVLLGWGAVPLYCLPPLLLLFRLQSRSRACCQQGILSLCPYWPACCPQQLVHALRPQHPLLLAPQQYHCWMAWPCRQTADGSEHTISASITAAVSPSHSSAHCNARRHAITIAIGFMPVVPAFLHTRLNQATRSDRLMPSSQVLVSGDKVKLVGA